MPIEKITDREIKLILKSNKILEDFVNSIDKKNLTAKIENDIDLYSMLMESESIKKAINKFTYIYNLCKNYEKINASLDDIRDKIFSSNEITNNFFTLSKNVTVGIEVFEEELEHDDEIKVYLLDTYTYSKEKVKFYIEHKNILLGNCKALILNDNYDIIEFEASEDSKIFSDKKLKIVEV